MIDASGAVVFWNAAAEQLFGLERSRAIGQELASLIFPDHLQTAVRAVLLREVDEPGDELSPAADRARGPPGRRPRDPGRHRHDADRARRDAVPRHLTSAMRASAASASASSTPMPAGDRPCSTSGRSRSRAWPSTQLLQRAVALSIDELGVDRCEVWKRDEGGETLTLRANVGWPEAEAGTQVPLATATQPGYTLLRGPGSDRRRGLPPRGPVRLDRADRRRPGPELDLDPDSRYVRAASDRSSPPPRTCAASSSATSASSSRSRRRSARRSSAPGRSIRSPTRSSRSAS